MGEIMNEYRPFIDDPRDLAALEGKRYVVLRPDESVSEIHSQVRSKIRAKLWGLPVTYPAAAHLTIAGFPTGTSLTAVQRLVADWAPRRSPLLVELDGGVGFFPEPYKTVILQVRKTEALFHALSDLRRSAEEQRLHNWAPGTVPAVEDWVFHISVAYCSSLSSEAWYELLPYLKGLRIDALRCTIYEAEVAAIDNGVEYSGGHYPFK
jgi:2'-5' RNA ligase